MNLFDYLGGNQAQAKTNEAIVLDYQPREQFLDFHQRDERFAAMVVHRRAGKTVAAIHDIVIKALRTTKKQPRYAYVAPFYSQAKSIAWTYLKDAVRGFALEMRESELSVTLPNGAVIRLFGADNPDTLRGLYFDGIVLDEFGDFRPKLYGEVILPTIADRQGWLLAIGTPKGKNNAFYQICQRAKYSEAWYFKELKASTSGLLPQSELDLMREQMSPEQYDQEFEISFSAALIGTYYSTQINMMEQQGRIDKKYDYDPNFPVYTASDIGITDSTVFWFWQPRPDGICVFDM
jgi:phage terminase large subunit